MAVIVPFIGTRYDTKVVGNLGNVICPPYDVITPQMQDDFYAKNTHCFIRLVLGKQLPTDDDYNNRYERAARCFHEWKKEGILVDDEELSFYLCEQEFTIPGGKTLRRRGFFASVKIEDGPGAKIRPHEQTFPGPKEDRLKLLRATQSNLSPIFALCSDPKKEIVKLLDKKMSKKPLEEFVDTDGVKTRLWICQSSSDIQQFQETVQDQDLLIADGHHRYETAKTYRNEMRRALSSRQDNMPFDYVMMYVTSLEDEGLVILPTHRGLRPDCCVGVDLEEILGELADYFAMDSVKLDFNNPVSAADVLLKRIESGKNRQISMAMVLPNRSAYVLTLKPDVKLEEIMVDEDLHPAIRDLDVSVLHHFIIKQIWIGNPEMELDEGDIVYSRDASVVIESVKRRQACAGFLINAPRVEQVKKVTEQSLLIPQKSTYFYPKIPSGIVVRDISRH